MEIIVNGVNILESIDKYTEQMIALEKSGMRDKYNELLKEAILLTNIKWAVIRADEAGLLKDGQHDDIF